MRTIAQLSDRLERLNLGTFVLSAVGNLISDEGLAIMNGNNWVKLEFLNLSLNYFTFAHFSEFTTGHWNMLRFLDIGYEPYNQI